MKVQPLSLAELRDLPPVTNLPTLAKALGVSEPVIRERHRLGELERLGIRVLPIGAQWRVRTEDIFRVLGISRDADSGAP